MSCLVLTCMVFRPLMHGELLLGDEGTLITQSLGHQILSALTSVAAKAILIANADDAGKLLGMFTDHAMYYIADKHYFHAGLVPHNHKPLLTTSHKSLVRARTRSLC